MDLKQLRYFVTIAEEEQLTRAAKRLHMAQPPLSRQLILLEEELGVTLMERHGRRMELTKSGKLLFKKAQSLLQQLDETVKEIKETGEGLRGELSIGTFISCMNYLPKKIRYFRENYPLVSFQLQEVNPLNLIENLENRNIEFALVRLPLKMDKFSKIKLPTEPFVLVIPAHWNMLTSKTTVHMQEIANIPLLSFSRGKELDYQEIIIDECRRFGFEPNFVFECPNAAILTSLLIAGIGASILPKSMVSFISNSHIKVIDILDITIQSDSAVIWLKDRQLSKSAERFIEALHTDLP
ncbi:LysR family transcriptional regulator [Gottfriedia sp. NPDC057991]|uniref:LysR family transcriptional regulator n=1 Tax=Gottfriedia sp. NPDC057991 TaxID=3346298 RepID=UPI0036DC6117